MNRTFERDLKRIRQRIRLLLIEKHALMLGAAGAGLGVVLLLLSRWNYSLGEPPVLIGAVLAGLLAGVVWGTLRRLTPFAAARAAERRLELKERLSSAVALSSSDDEMVQALVEDAGGHIAGIRPKDVFPHRFTREMGAFAIAVVVLLGLFYIPQIPTLQSPTRREEVKVMKEEGRKLRKLAKESIKHVSPQNEEIIKRVALNMEKLGKKLEAGRMNRKQAMVAIKKLSKEVQKAQDQIAARNKSPKSLAQAGKDLASMSPELAKKMLERLEEQKQKNLAAGKHDPKLAELEKRLKEMQEGSMSGEKMQQLQKQMSEYLKSQSGVPLPPELAQMMSELLKNEDYKKAMELMSQLAKKLGKGEMSEQDMKNLEEQLKAMVKALEGTDLNELAKKMKQAAEQLAKMDPEEAAKLLEQMKNMKMMTAEDLAKLGKMDGG